MTLSDQGLNQCVMTAPCPTAVLREIKHKAFLDTKKRQTLSREASPLGIFLSEAQRLVRLLSGITT